MAATDPATGSGQDAFENLLRDWFGGLRRDLRQVWTGAERAHLQVRAPAPGSPEEVRFAEAVRGWAAEQPQLNWARFNAQAGRVVIDRPDPEADLRPLLRRLRELETELNLLERDLATPGGPHGRHPADLEPILREAMELAVELAGGGLGLALHGSDGGQRLGLDLALLLRCVEAVPKLRGSVERLIGADAAELLLTLADGVDHALLRGLAGPLVALLERALTLRTRLRQRHCWQQQEARLSRDPTHHPELREAAQERPLPLPPGPIERYAEQATMASLGAFGFGLAATADLEGSAGAVLAALPRPALLGRRAFVAQIVHKLGELGSVVLDAEALERLDRLDCVVIDRALLDPRWGQALLSAARDAGLIRVVLAGPDDRLPGDVERRCSPDQGLAGTVRLLQSEGRVVLALAAGPQPGLAAADLALGFQPAHCAPPWQAHVIAGPDLGAAWLLLRACGAARRCADQSVQTAMVEVVVGLALCLDGVHRRSALAVNQATNLLAVIAIANGVRLARAVEAQPAEPAADTIPWHALGVEEVLERLGVSREGLESGLPGDPVNSPEAARKRPLPDWLRLSLEELDSPLVPVLVTGAGLSALLASPVDAALIASVLFGNAVIGGLQRLRVERAVAALQAQHAAPVWVRRRGELRRIDTAALRLADVVRLEAGDVVPADCRILVSTGLQVDEAVLSGESFPVGKGADACDAAALAERSSMVYAGTTVVAGSAEAVVIALGEATEARRGLAAVRHAGLASGVEGRLESLTAITTPIAAMSGVAVLLSALAQGRDPRLAFGEGVALTVAAVPEGLPVLASLSQLAAASRLSREKVLVRNPRAIESLGRINVLCLDKTGTLTSGRIRLVAVCSEAGDQSPDQLDALGRQVLQAALRATPQPEAGKRLAHPTDQGLLEGAAEAGLGRGNWRIVATLPFEPGRGYHANLCQRQDARQLCVKGSPEVVLAACSREATAQGWVPLDSGRRAHWIERACQLAERGWRVLAVAERPLEATPERPHHPMLSDEQVDDLIFHGFVALEDPIRDSARQALADLRRAGVNACIITGDHPATAHAVARQLELPGDGHVVTGPMLDAMREEELEQLVLSNSIFARITSMQKLRLVRALRQANQVVAMAGDGANDAAAIRLADVGIALGARATEAARSAADLVVTDGRIETIVQAVLEGRALWRSVRDAVGLLVGGNLGEIGFTLLAGLKEGRPPLNTRQLLMMNLLTDVAPALAIAMRPPPGLSVEELIQEGPEASLGSPLEQNILRTAAVTALSSGVARAMAGVGGDQRAADTVGLLTLVGTQLGQALAGRGSDGISLITGLASCGVLVAVVQTPGLSQAFGCRPLGPIGLGQAGAATAMGTAAGVLPSWLWGRLRDGLSHVSRASGTQPG